MEMQSNAGATFIRGPELRQRWGNMANSTFYARLKKEQIPKPCYPFGPDTPYWRIDEIEAHERKAVASK
jgi:predicted DNA-binding transcriptional regulator AlpA